MSGSAGRFAPGARLGDYRVERELVAKPGELAVEATHTVLPRRARILSLHPAFAGIQTIALQLMREACILEALRHPGVPRVYECGVLSDRRPWVAIELVEGPTLAELLAAAGPLPVIEVIGLLREVAEILHHAHTRGLVHHNVRPEAITRRAEGACLTDWGAARGHDTPEPLLVPPDSLAYQAPEVVAGEGADRRADLYSLGVVVYEALTLDHPTLSARARLPGAPPRLTALIDRMLSPDPAARPTSAEVRAEAISLVDLVEISVPMEIDEPVIEEVEIQIDAMRDSLTDPPLVPLRDPKLRWTPAGAYQLGPAPRPAVREELPAPAPGLDPSSRGEPPRS
ncbi:MAG: serine/threonine-protein kinase [Kofleriaceae bacterium]